MARYKAYMTDAALQNMPFVQESKDRVLQAASSSAGPSQYIAGAEIDGDELRVFADQPIFCGPLVCQLCDANFVDESSFASHQTASHGGELEYRKRVLYLMEQSGNRPITAQEKRIMVQNFAHFQQFSRPGSKSNTFVSTPEVPRCEAACVLCQQKDWVENRHKLCLFGKPPAEILANGPGASVVPEHALLSLVPEEAVVDGELDAAELPSSACASHSLLQRGGVYYLQSPEGVHELLSVERYAQRWSLIPLSELHASSVQHPEHSEWRWLLRVRRAPTMAPPAASSAAAAGCDLADTRPPCAGVGDPDAVVWVCWDCLVDIGARKSEATN